jgi:hypothetical protein
MDSKATPSESKETIQHAMAAVENNDHQDLAKENLGNEAEEQPPGDPDNPYRLKGMDDKRPEDSSIKKGWTVDSNTSRNPQDLATSEDDDELSS